VYRKLRSDCVCCHLVEKKRQTPHQSWSISPLCPLPLSCWHSHLFWPWQFATSDKWVFKLFNLFIFCNVHFNSQSFDYTSNWFFWVLEETGGEKKENTVCLQDWASVCLASLHYGIVTAVVVVRLIVSWLSSSILSLFLSLSPRCAKLLLSSHLSVWLSSSPYLTSVSRF
jgi:hypothetical protein